ncbi:MAG: hypothetical protein PF495_21625 [Spirochaetales bacterium]|jgi:hypothetical protein|nr:hypothetical protein [Spirochaetales bacterium]
MLFTYQHVRHDITKLQKYQDHLVKEVWCKASGRYSMNLLDPEFREIVREVKKNSKKNDFLDGPIRKIFYIFRDHLDAGQRAQIAKWYDTATDIRKLCSRQTSNTAPTYKDLRAINSDLGAELKKFCDNLWGNVIDLAPVIHRHQSIKQHYDKFITKNPTGKCPYCGINDFEGQYSDYREAYDHYIPKGTYPFSSINFRNLSPMCHKCNSTYKGTKNPIKKGSNGKPQKAFYPYSKKDPQISISVNLRPCDVGSIEPADFDLEFKAPGADEELETWKRLFGIESRYKDKICLPNEAKSWLVLVADDCYTAGLTPKQALEKFERCHSPYPWVGANFLKIPFMRGCEKAGLIM